MCVRERACVCECVEERLCIYRSGGARQGICVLVDEGITCVFVVVKEYNKHVCVYARHCFSISAYL